jgi:tryptophanyl-tRNA synthetase
MVADWHALTTDYENPADIESNIEAMVLDWLAGGLDPKKSVIFRQSWIPAHAQLALILSMITPLSWLERNPTYKDQVLELKDKAISTHGFLGYPVLQAADILLYEASHVPVGEDQLPHLELTRELARRFNHLYQKPVFVEPQAILSQSPKVLGLDGRKMSKSYDNCIDIAQDAPTFKKKINAMFTDPLKIRSTDPGHPNPCPENPTGCVVFSLHQIYENSKAALAIRETSCKNGTLGCVPCKKDLWNTMEKVLEKQREKKQAFVQKKGLVQDILREGTQTAQALAEKTLGRVQEALGLKTIEWKPTK